MSSHENCEKGYFELLLVYYCHHCAYAGDRVLPVIAVIDRCMQQ